MPENEIARLTKEAVQPRTWSRGALVLTFMSAAPFVALFVVVAGLEHPWAGTAAYAVLFAWASLQFLWFAWSRQQGAGDLARRILVKSGWFIRDVPVQVAVGSAIGAVVPMSVWLVARPGLHAPDWPITLTLIATQWFVVAPVETFLQAWVWPMVMPGGPVTAQVLFVAMHGARALDPMFAVAAFALGMGFWLLCYLRYINWPGARFFGPVAAWSAHAMWNCLLLFMGLSWSVM